MKQSGHVFEAFTLSGKMYTKSDSIRLGRKYGSTGSGMEGDRRIGDELGEIR